MGLGGPGLRDSVPLTASAIRMSFPASLPSKLWRFLTGFEFTILKRPAGPRQAAVRLATVAAIVAAVLVPILLLEPDGADVRAIAGEQFLADLEELDTLTEQIAALKDDAAAGRERATLEARAAELTERTQLGYLPREGDAPQVGALAPDFRLLDLDGIPVRLREVGTPAVVNFWASWCTFCIEEMPDFQRVHALAGDDVTIIGINRAEPLPVARRFADETGATYALVLDTEDELGGVYRVIGMPTTLYIGADGRVAEMRIGFTTFDQIRESVERITGERLAADTPVDAGYGERVRDLIDSQRANHAVAGDLFARFAIEPGLDGDVVWQRNVIGQARAWLVNLRALQALAPSGTAAAAHRDLVDSLLPIETAAALFEAAIDAGDAGRIARGIALFEQALPAFNDAAATLLAVLGPGQ